MNYQEESRATWRAIDCGVNPEIDTYCVIGLCNEAGELAGEISEDSPTIHKIKHEIGDNLWYLTQLATCFGFTLDEVKDVFAASMISAKVVKVEWIALRYVRATGELAGIIKKVFRDQNGVIVERHQDTLMILARCYWWLSMIAYYYDLAMEEVMRANLAKLADRQRRGVIGGSGDER